MATETIEEFLARGGKVEKSKETTSFDNLLYNTGLLNHEEAESIKNNLNESINTALKSETQKNQ